MARITPPSPPAISVLRPHSPHSFITPDRSFRTDKRLDQEVDYKYGVQSTLRREIPGTANSIDIISICVIRFTECLNFSHESHTLIPGASGANAAVWREHLKENAALNKTQGCRGEGTGGNGFLTAGRK